MVLEPGVAVNIPVQSIQRDPEYYPDPEKFDPERFNDENKSTRPTFTFLSFGDGPRNCIGKYSINQCLWNNALILIIIIQVLDLVYCRQKWEF